MEHTLATVTTAYWLQHYVPLEDRLASLALIVRPPIGTRIEWPCETSLYSRLSVFPSCSCLRCVYHTLPLSPAIATATAAAHLVAKKTLF